MCKAFLFSHISSFLKVEWFTMAISVLKTAGTISWRAEPPRTPWSVSEQQSLF